MVQAAILDGQFLDLFPPFDNGSVTPEVGVGRCDVIDALVVAVVIVMIDEDANLVFKVTRQEIVFQQDLVLEGLMPALDLTLGLRVVGSPSNMVHSVIVGPVRQVAGDIRLTVIAEQPGLVKDRRAVAAPPSGLVLRRPTGLIFHRR